MTDVAGAAGVSLKTVSRVVNNEPGVRPETAALVHDALLRVPAGDDHEYLQPELRLGTPVVFIDRPPGGMAADVVLLDNVGGARRGVEHLLAHGHRRIAMIGDERTIFTAVERLRGYR